MTHLEKNQIELGYIPLLDCIAILWAKHQGFFEAQGLNVTLVKEVSWASLRDRLAFGMLDAAHCLSAMLPAASIGADQVGIPFQTSIILSQNCAKISLSQKLSYDLSISATDQPNISAQKIFQALQHETSIQLAHVFPYSIHHYCLREWLALANLDCAKNLKLLTFPPPYMVEAISNHTIDGFCVGEPWNIQGEILGVSQIIASSQTIIPPVADKVLAFTQEWATQHPNTVQALTRAINAAQQDLKQMSDFQAVWQLLVDYHIVQFKSSETIHTQHYYAIQQIIQHFIQDTSEPKLEDFQWLIAQMEKWGQIPHSDFDPVRIAQDCICLS